MPDLQELTGRLSKQLPAGARLRSLSDEDAPAVAAIADRLGQTEHPDYWRRKLESGTRAAECCLGVEVDGQLVAYMLGDIKGGEFGLTDEIGWLELLGVHPAWQGQGLARALAEALFEQFTDKGVQRVLTLVSAREDNLRPFFRSLGFRQSQLVSLERRL